MPKRYGVTSGLVISPGLGSDVKAPHFDVIIYDQLESPVLWVTKIFDNSEQWRSRAIPVEYVRFIIEVKASFSAANVRHASIRKRTLPSGATRWQLDYKDAQGARRHKDFEFQWQAKAHETTVRGEIRDGLHVPDSTSITVAEAGEIWLQQVKLKQREAGTIRNYRLHLDRHIKPLIGGRKLSRLTRPMVEAFKDRLLGTHSWILAKKVISSLSSLLSESQRRGLIVQNAAAGVKVEKIGERHEEGIKFPSKNEVQRIIAGSAERWPETEPWRAMILTAIFSGLRQSELRGLPWSCVNFERKIIRVKQRADRFNELGSPKSRAGRREVPLAPVVANTLRRWKLACPPGALDLVFPTANGSIIRDSRVRKKWAVLMQALDLSGSGFRFHDLRHVAASLFIEQGGWQPKKIQTVMGHSSIQITFDRYGHLFAAPEDDQAAMAQIEARLFS